MSYCSISRISVINFTKIYLEHNGDPVGRWKGSLSGIADPAQSPTTQDSGIVSLDPLAGVCMWIHQQGYTDCHCGQEASWDSPDLHFSWTPQKSTMPSDGLCLVSYLWRIRQGQHYVLCRHWLTPSDIRKRRGFCPSFTCAPRGL